VGCPFLNNKQWEDTMSTPTVTTELRERLVEVIRQRCSRIGREWLNNVEPKEVAVQQRINCKSHALYVCSIRGMTYNVCLNDDRERFSIYDPDLAATTNEIGKKMPRYNREHNL